MEFKQLFDTNLVSTESRENTKNLRIAVVSDAAPDRNGVGTYYSDLVNHLSGHVANTLHICPQSNNSVPIGMFSFPMPGDSTQRICLPHFRKLKQQLELFKPDTVIIPTPGPYGLSGMRYSLRLGAKLVVGFHTDFHSLSNLYWNRFGSRFVQFYLTWSHRILFHRSSRVFTNSQVMADTALELGADNVNIMGTFIPAEFLENPRKIRTYSSRTSTIMFVGRLAPEKNIQAVLHAAEMLPETQFVIAGTGPLREMVEGVARRLSNLSYVGWQSRKDILTLLDGTDLLVLPSLVESFGTVAVEAMARRCIVLLSSNCGLLEWPQLRRGVFVIRDNETLSTAIRRVTAIAPQFLVKKSEVALIAVEEFNRWSLDHWLKVLNQK